MALPSFFKRKASAAPTAPAADPLADEAGPVQAARAQARRRLIGAVVLLAVGVVVFPMLFETQPRPLAKDIPIELPKRDAAAAKAPPAVPPAPPAVAERPLPEPAAPGSSAAATATPPASVEADKPAAAAPVAPASAAGDAPPKRVAAAASAPRPEPPAADPRKAESERALAALEGRSDAPVAAAPGGASDAKAGRFVVQVGAYTDAATLLEVRAKVEKLGLKTYTQSVDTEAGKRTRVRVGPFATRQEAESASTKLKGAGLPGNVLVL
jgi:DedD protein